MHTVVPHTIIAIAEIALLPHRDLRRWGLNLATNKIILQGIDTVDDEALCTIYCRSSITSIYFWHKFILLRYQVSLAQSSFTEQVAFFCFSFTVMIALALYSNTLQSTQVRLMDMKLPFSLFIDTGITSKVNIRMISWVHKSSDNENQRSSLCLIFSHVLLSDLFVGWFFACFLAGQLVGAFMHTMYNDKVSKEASPKMKKNNENLIF